MLRQFYLTAKRRQMGAVWAELQGLPFCGFFRIRIKFQALVFTVRLPHVIIQRVLRQESPEALRAEKDVALD